MKKVANQKRALFSQATIDFIEKAGRQKKADWLDKNREEYEAVILNPMKDLMQATHLALKEEARGYHFPLRNLGRLKRNADSAKEGKPFRDWIGVSVSRDSGSRYESCPNLYFSVDHEDILTAGGLYMPSADQTKHIRKWIDQDPSALEELLEDAKFKKVYKELGTERMLKTKPRDYPVDHPKFNWLKLSGWYVWRPIRKKDFFSKNFAELVIADWRQVLRLNAVLDQYTSSWPKAHGLDVMPTVTKRELDWDDDQ